MEVSTAVQSTLFTRLTVHAINGYGLTRDTVFIGIRAWGYLLRGKIRTNEVMGHIVRSGVESLPMILFATAFSGVVVTSEMAYHMDLALQTVEMIPGFSGQFIFREVGIAIPAMLLVAKVGAATTAEVGTMRVTEQIDALRLLRIDPVEYLVAPRLAASLVVYPALTFLAILVTLVCAVGVACVEHGFNVLQYITALSHFLKPMDVVCAFSKALAFAAVIPVICCSFGFQCRGGAEGVGSATTNAVVASTLSVIVLDFILSFAFSGLLH
jgi:phospholipid/cholesterol/gamma-HCH transport system permease protein